MNQTARDGLVAYGVAVIATAVSLLMRAYLLEPVLGHKTLYISFCPAVLIAAYFGGLRPGLLATILTAVAINFFFVEPYYSLGIRSADDALAVSFFVVVGVFISGLCESLHRSWRQIVANERRYAVTLSSIGDAVIATDKRARITFMNPVAESLTGWPQGDAAGQPLPEVFRIVNEQSRQLVEDPAAKVLRLGTVVGLANHTVLLARDGREVPINDSGAPIIDDRGDITGVVLVFRDSTQHRESEKRFRAFVDHATDAFFLQDERHMVLDVNRQACESLGYTREELLGMVPTEFDPDVTPSDMEEISRKLNDGEVMAFESRHRRKDGTVFPVEIRGQSFWEGGRRFTVALARDITERKRSEEALRASERRWRSLTEALPQLVWTATPDGACDYFSTQWTLHTGVPESELLGWCWLETLHNEDRERTRQAWTAAVQGPTTYDVEYRVRHTDGEYRWFKTRGVPIRDDSGNIYKWFGTCTDITASKQLEEELRLVNARLDLAVRGSNLAIWELEMPDGRVENSNWTFVNVWEPLGYDSHEVPTDFVSCLPLVVHPDDLERISREIQEFLESDRREFEAEHRNRHKDGSDGWCLERGVAVRDPEGKPIRFIGSTVDITDLKRAEEALRESEQRWRGLTEALPQLVWTATPDGSMDYASAQIVQYMGRPESELLGWGWLELLHPDDVERTRQAWQDAASGQSEYEIEHRFRRFDGTYRWFKTRGVAIQNSIGGVFKWFGTSTDITDSKTAAGELRIAKETAESANRAKDEFLANVSHEIRTPMNAILGMTELVLDTSLAEDQRQSLKTVKAAADNLLGIINDLLDFSKIEAGKLVLDPADFSVRSVLGETLRTLAMRAHRKGLELISDVQPGVPDRLVGDFGRLRQVLLNLVGNALKFTEKGDVLVRVECANEPTRDGDPPQEVGMELALDERQELLMNVRSQVPQEVRLLFSVTDTGIGVPPDKHEAIFRAFEQEDTSTTRKYGGTGLGLTIASRLVALMGGKISVDSQPGRGSTFAFTASFGRQSQFSEPISAQPPVLLHDLPVLIVDDNETNRHILKEWLREWKMMPTAVGDGVAAMDALWQGVTNERPFALVLLDARMPDTDGLALAARIRERTARSATRIVLLTSGDRPDDAARSHQLGIDARLLKPVRPEELLETIYRVMSRTNGDVPMPAGPAPDQSPIRAQDQTATSLRILVAEDNEFNSQLLEQLLLRRGHSVKLAINGREALCLANKESFDLLLLDIHMPELDGFEVIQAIRERERLGEHLHVIALTARSRNEDRDKCLAAGMDDFLAKPIHAAALWDAIDQVVTSKAAPTASNSEAMEKNPGLFDARVLLAACGNNDSILRNICAVFRDHLPDHLHTAQDALRNGNAPQLREAAHKLCGMIAAFSSVAGAMASDLEDHAAAGYLEACQPLLEQLDRIARELIQQIHGLSIETLRHQATTLAASEPTV